MEIYEFPDCEFKIIVLRRLSKLQENTNRQLSESEKQYMAKMRDATKKNGKMNQTDILELKNTVNEIVKCNKELQ